MTLQALIRALAAAASVAALSLSVLLPAGCATAPPAPPAPAAEGADAPADQRAVALIRAKYTKSEHRVPMRDGAHLFTTVYTPRAASPSNRYPILYRRTPYSVRPYGPDRFPEAIGPSRQLESDGYIFVLQDVRGRSMSEGTFDHMRPHIADKHAPLQFDESTDTYDSIQWMMRTLPHHNGRVGMWGISYPGFYCSAGMIDAHPALKAVSPQAPVADFFFDDFHHHGAFFLPHAFNFMSSFGRPRPEPTTRRAEGFKHPTRDGYQFFLDMGPLSNADALYFKGEISFWDVLMKHPNYDHQWQSRNILPHLRNVAPAVMVVGGWFDAEDLYGPLKTYASIERLNPSAFNILVMGPWYHGQWARDEGERLGGAHFGAKTSLEYRDRIERRFFDHHLKDGPPHRLPEASVFETGANRWREFDQWPPASASEHTLYCRAGGTLDALPPATADSPCVEFISDPARPVPYTQVISTGMTKAYMTDDQRFAARRPDVAVFQTPALTEPLTLAGPISVDLWVSTSGTDSDWVVKVIDVFPPDAPDHDGLREGEHMSGYQLMVRSEVMRGRFRDSYEHPAPFTPGQPTLVRIPLLDVLHTFKPGHRLMVQVQCSWFPLVDRNPQTFVPNIFEAREQDFVRATQRVYHAKDHPTSLRFGVIPTLPLPAGTPATGPAAAPSPPR